MTAALLQYRWPAMMRVSGIVGIAIALAGCNEAPSHSTKHGYVEPAGDHWGGMTATDPETGCRYLIGYGYMTSRLRSDGQPDCPGSNGAPK